MNQGVSAIRWGGNYLELLDQRLLPLEELWVRCGTVAEVVDAIREMIVRGAPAIGISAAYGVVLAAAARYQAQPGHWREGLLEDVAALAQSRPTAVNLFWALDRMRVVIDTLPDGDSPVARLEQEAIAIHEEDVAANQRMGELGAQLMKEEQPFAVITHCNTGSLATGGYGTALGVIRSAHKAGLITSVFADETRPWLQGARLTAWELLQEGIPASLIADSAAAHVMKSGAVRWVIVGADRITANGDVANKIGTYSLAVLARYHGVKFMVVAPTSTIDMQLATGREIPIEERTQEELLKLRDMQLAPATAKAFNPVFDVTPAELIDAIVTEKGVILNPDPEKMAEHMSQ